MKIFTILLVVCAVYFSCKNQDTTSNAVETAADSVYLRLNNEDFQAKMLELPNAQLIDVRTPREYEKGSIDGAKMINFKDNNFATEIGKLDKSQPVLVYCQAGGRSSSACQMMVKEGFKEIYELKNGYGNWK